MRASEHCANYLKTSGARASRGRRRFSDCVRGPEDIICGVLRLRGCVDQEPSIVAKLLEPAGHVRGLILDDCGCNACFRAKVGGSHFRAQFFF